MYSVYDHMFFNKDRDKYQILKPYIINIISYHFTISFHKHCHKDQDQLIHPLMNLQLSYWKNNNPRQIYNFTPQKLDTPIVILIQTSTSISKNIATQDLFISNPQQENKQDVKEVLRVLKAKDKYVLTQIDPEKHDLCITVESLQQSNKKQVELKENSILKLSKSTLKVAKIKYNYEKYTKTMKDKLLSLQDKIYNYIQPSQKIGQFYYENLSFTSTIQESPLCRYCYKKSFDTDNLISIICNCEGLTKYVHQQCLREWYSQKCKYEKKKNNLFFALRDIYFCQICKYQINIELILPCFKNNLTQYVILQVQTKGLPSQLWVIDVQKERDTQITIGRSIDNTISIKDLSVSRNHCVLIWKLNQPKLILKDLGSRFGTLVKQQVVIVKQIPMYLQLGDTKILVKQVQKQRIGKKMKNSLLKLASKLGIIQFGNKKQNL